MICLHARSLSSWPPHPALRMPAWKLSVALLLCYAALTPTGFIRTTLTSCLQEIKFAGLDVYATGSTEKPSAAIILIHDIWTWKVKNIRLLGDKLGSEGKPFAGLCQC